MKFFKLYFPILVLLLILFVIGFNSWQHYNINKKCSVESKATITAYKPVFEYTQSEHQGQLKLLKGFDIQYQFIINDSIIAGAEFVTNNFRNKKIIKSLNATDKQEITILYSPFDFNTSCIKK